MNEAFDLPVFYRGKELSLPAQWVQVGYTHRFQVEAEGQLVLFEPDEEGQYRAIVDVDTKNKTLDVELLQAIAEGISKVLE